MNRSLVLLMLIGCGAPPDTASKDGDSGTETGQEDTGAEAGDTGRLNTNDRDNDGFDEGADCDDLDPDVNPDADERCNGRDDNCDGSVDDDAVDAHTWYADEDGDGWGTGRTEACDAPAGSVAASGDCDDADPSISPGQAEVCDGIDNDCDDAVDDADADVDNSTGVQFHLDADGDGFGAVAETWACIVPDSAVEDATDCDDTRTDVSPIGSEVCDDVDNDCDGSVDWDHRVPTNYPAIQAGIDAADAGDTVCVEAGTYTENLELLGFDLSIIGTEGSLSTTIDGGAAGSVVTFGGWESAATVFEGFTITNGFATNGAGVWLGGASATLRDVVITGNSCVSTACNGVGLFSEGGAPVLDGVDAFVNDADGDTVAGVGAWFYGASPTITNSSFDENYATATQSAYGIGAAFEACTGTVVETTIEANYTALTGNGELRGSLSVIESDVVFTDVSTSENQGDGSTGTAIAAAGVYESDANSTWTRIELSGNVATASEVDAAGLLVAGSTSTWSNVIIAGNRAVVSNTIDCAGATFTSGSSVVLMNATVYGNEIDGLGTASEMLGAGLCLLSDTTLRNVTVSSNRGNDVTQAGGVYVAGATASVSYTNVYGNDVANWVGMDDPTGTDGNLSVDPGFTDASAVDAIDWDLMLAAGSGLIDAGDPAILDVDGSRSDLGAFGGPGGGW